MTVIDVLTVAYRNKPANECNQSTQYGESIGFTTIHLKVTYVIHGEKERKEIK